MILALEGLPAELAGESALVAVGQLVLGQGGRAREHFAAHLLGIRKEEDGWMLVRIK